MSKLLKKFMSNENGATAIEYALMLAGIAAVIITTVYSLGTATNESYQSVSDKWPKSN